MIAGSVIVDELAAELPTFLKVDEAAKLLRIHPRHVRRLTTSDELEGAWQRRPGGPILIPKRSILGYIEARL
jgi:excisionase family DNA binding protein